MDVSSGAHGGKALARVASAGIGGWISALAGPEAGAAAGQALSEASDVLTERVRRRIGRLADHSRAEEQRRLEAGEKRRQDRLLDPDSEAREEILESILRAAIETEEERKCAAIAALANGIEFDERVSGADALMYLRLVRAMSWRQLRALAFFADASREEQRERIAWRAEEGDTRIQPTLEAELSEMARSLEVIGFTTKDGSVTNPSNTWGGSALAAASLSKIAPTGVGRELLRLTALPRIVTDAELDDLHRELGG